MNAHNTIPPEQVEGGPYAIDPAALNQPYGVPQETVGAIAEDLMLAVTGEGYAAHEVVFAAFTVNDAGEGELQPDVPAPEDEGTAFLFWTVGDLAGTAEEYRNPIHDAGTTPRARIGVYDYMGLLRGDVPPVDGGVRLELGAEAVRQTLAIVFHPKYEAAQPEITDPDDLIGQPNRSNE